jgi:predicted neutral ceramidase superfamily lipid hydrolase
VALPISSGGIWLISFKVIVEVAYLGSWVLVPHVITSKILLDFCPFLLEIIVVNNLRPLFFLIHLRLVQKFLPLKATTCVPPFEQMVEKSANRFQKNIFREITQPFLY